MDKDNLILELFSEACLRDGYYDHMFMSVYEETQEYLIKKGLIKESECLRKSKAP